MPDTKLFPIERCSPRLKEAILAEFQGRCPTLQEIVSVPLKTWLTIPGIGQASLTELDNIIQSQLGKTKRRKVAKPMDAELSERLDRLERELERLHRDIQGLISTLRLAQHGPGRSDDESKR